MVSRNRDHTITACRIDLPGQGFQGRFDVIRILPGIVYGNICVGIDTAFPEAGFNQDRGYGIIANIDTKNWLPIPMWN